MYISTTEFHESQNYLLKNKISNHFQPKTQQIKKYFMNNIQASKIDEWKNAHFRLNVLRLLT